MDSSRGQLVIPQSAWHWRWYQTWARLSGKYRSSVDLCHYMRVVIFFAPWRAFWQYELPLIKKGWFFRPWEPTLLSVGIGGLTLLTLWYDWMVKIWIGLGIVAAVTVVVVGLAMFTEKFPKVHQALGRIAMTVLRPVGRFGAAIGRVIARPVSAIYRKALRPAAVWFFEKRLFFILANGSSFAVQPWGLALVLGWLVGFGFSPLWASAAIGVGATGFALILGLFFLGFWIHDDVYLPWRENKNPQVKVKDGTGMASMSWQWIISKKHRVCPLILAQ